MSADETKLALNFRYHGRREFRRIARKYHELKFSRSAIRAIDERVDNAISLKATKIFRRRLVKENVLVENKAALIKIASEIAEDFRFRVPFGPGRNFTQRTDFKAALKSKLPPLEYFSRLVYALEQPNPAFDWIDFSIMAFWGPGASYRNVPISPLMSMRDADAAQFVTNILLRNGSPITEVMYKKRRQRLGLFSGTKQDNSRPRQISRDVFNGARCRSKCAKSQRRESSSSCRPTMKSVAIRSNGPS